MNETYTGLHCIVTGGAGFIGQNLVNALLQQGAHVYVIDNFSYGAKRSSIHPSAHIYPGDIASYASFQKLPKKEYSYLFHFAGPSSVLLFNKTTDQCINETVQGFQNALQYCALRSIKLVFPSSGSLYAGTATPQKETSPLYTNNMNIYAKTKYQLEQIQESYSAQCDMLGLRIFAGYGPSENHKGDIASVLYSFCKQIHARQRPTIYGNGDQERDFIYISDIVDAILTLAQCCNEKLVNIGSGTSTSFKDLISEINRVAERNIEPIYIDKPSGYLEKTLADISLLKKYFNQPLTPLSKGITHIMQSL